MLSLSNNLNLNKMKKVLISLALTASTCLFAQTGNSPFAKYGYDKQIMYTSSKGEFEEFHDQTDVVEIGTALFDTRTNKFVGFVSDEQEKNEIAAAISAMAPDPLCEKYYWISPYAYCLNNPVNMIDPDGRDAVFIAFPDYKISAFGRQWSNLGHAGVLLIDNKTGLTKYYEYGRYDAAERGEVRQRTISNVVIDKETGKPTVASLNKVMGEISDKAGKGGRIEGAYIESDKFKEMNDYAQSKKAENNNPDRKEYSITANNCGTFAADVVKQDPEVKEKAPTIIDPRPNSMVKEYQDKFKPIIFDPNTK